MNWYFEVLKKYAVFSGRAGRMEFWLFSLISYVIGIILTDVTLLISGKTGPQFINDEILFAIGKGHPLHMEIVPNLIYALAMLIPGIAVTVRRLHDTGRSAWWLLLFLIPLFGPIVLLVFWAQDSNDFENRFGPSPKLARA